MKLIVNAHKIEIEKEPVNEKEIDITKCEFEFADEITNDFVKEAYFTLNGVSYKQIIVNNECAIPYEVLQEKGQVEIGVVAYKVENEEEIKRYNPSPVFVSTLAGSLKDNAENSEPITPSEMEQYEQQLQNGLNDIQDKIDEVDDKLSIVDSKIDEIDTAIEETSNLDIDANKVDKTTTVEITKKDNTKKIVQILDGVSLQFMWQGTSLGIKTDNMQDYVFVDLQGVQGVKGDTGEPFRIKKTYSSVTEMNADFNNMEYGDYVMIASSVEIEDNAKLYTRGLSEWIFITDFSGATGIRGETGLTPIIRIGTVTSGATPSVTISGTAEEPILNFVLPKGDKGDKPVKGVDYFTQSDIDSMVAEVTEDATSEFNQNVTAKTNEFNTNATNKTTDFNTNATTKTTAFNDNATQKTNEFNTNAQNKTDEFNANKEALQEELDRYKMIENALPKVEGTGTSLTLNDTANAPMKMIPMASELEQETTTGKNLLPNILNSQTTSGIELTKNADGSIKLSGTATKDLYLYLYGDASTYPLTLVAGTYTLKSASNSNDTWIRLVGQGGVIYDSIQTANTFTLSNDTSFNVYLRIRNGATANVTLYPQLENGSTATNYEPYTGGNPSPNPQYPQEIHTISGDNEIKVENINLWDEEWELGYYGVDGTPYSSDSYIRSKLLNPIYVNPGTTYYIKTPANISLYICQYKEDGTFISRSAFTNQTFTPETNTSFIRFNLGGTYGTTYNNDVCINYSNPSFNGTYVPHEEQVLPLNLPVENLFDKTTAVDGYINNSGTITSSIYTKSSDYIKVENNKSYTISWDYEELSNVTTREIGFYDTSKTFISRQTDVSMQNKKITFTPNQDGYVRFDYDMNCYNVQFEEGTKANSYTPYGTEPLEVCKIGNYEDEFIYNETDTTLELNKWYLKKNIGKYVLDGSENWAGFSDLGTNARAYLTRSNVLKLSNGYSNYFSVSTNVADYTLDKTEMLFTPFDISLVVLKIPKTELSSTDLAGIKNWLSTHNTIAYCIKTTPTYILLNDTLQTQLNNIRDKVLAYQDQTNISQTNNDLPFTIKASAIRDMSNIFELIQGTEL